MEKPPRVSHSLKKHTQYAIQWNTYFSTLRIQTLKINYRILVGYKHWNAQENIYIHKYGETILTLMLPLNKSTHAFLHTWCLFHLATRSIVPVIPLKYRTRITLPFQNISLVHKLFGIRIGWTTRYEVGPQVMFLDLVAIYNII